MAERELTRQQRRFAREHGSHVELIWPPFALGLLFLMLGAPGALGLAIPGLPSDMGEIGVFFWIGLGVIVLGVVFNWFWQRIVGRQPGVFSQKQIATVLARGEVRSARVTISIEAHEYMRGPTPFHVVQVHLDDGKEACFGTFSGRLRALQRGDGIEVLWHVSVPALAIPAQLVNE